MTSGPNSQRVLSDSALPAEPVTQETKTLDQESNKRLRDFAEAASDWFWEMGPDLRLTYLSERIRDVLGLAPEHFLGKRREDYLDETSDPEAFRAHLDDLYKRRPFRNFVFPIEKPGAEGPLVVQINGKPFYDADGTFAGYRGTGTDLTSLVRSERKLEHTSALLRTTLEHMNHGISVTDADLNMVLWNDDFVELLEFPKDFPGPHGRPFADFIRYNAERGEYGPGDVEEQVHERVELAKRFEPHCFQRTRPDGVVLEIVGVPLPGGGFVTTYTDVTERAQHQTKLKEQADKMAELVEDLQRSNSELEQFAYVASHDLQEPLRMVASYCQLLQRRYHGTLDQDANEFIGFAVDGAGRMQQLINALLSYSRVGRSDRPRRRVSLQEAAEMACRDLQKAIEDAGATVDIDGLPNVCGDSVELRQLLQNLIANAIKFRADAPPEVRLTATRDGSDWIIAVADNGIGIAPEYAERIFLIFQRLHAREAYPGTGIGLSVCKKIVERHGGQLRVESDGKSGSTFLFNLPASDKAAS